MLALATPSPSPSPTTSSVDSSADLTLISPIRTYSIAGAYTAATYGRRNLRGAVVIPRIASFHVGHYLMRVTLPRIQTINGIDSAYGDLQLFYLLGNRLNSGRFYAGLFAQLPTGTGPVTTQKWLLGPAVAYIASFKPQARTVGVLLQSAFSVAGPRSAANQSAISFLPFANIQLRHGWFIKTPESPWLFDLQTGSTLVPVGIGFGRRGKLDAVPYLVALTDEVALIHANAPNAPKNIVRVTITFVLPPR
ncbi:MAG TPA: hypothetical protein VFN49_06060 [Candidatus Aquilonibacter sp.]|nr:hypothetical protein [Candidatus Aquilonibacter sp.]